MGADEDRPFSQEANTDEHGQEQPHTPTEGSEHVAVRNLETQQRRRKAVGCLLQVFALQLTLF
jgi:hypothetical protein